MLQPTSSECAVNKFTAFGKDMSKITVIKLAIYKYLIMPSYWGIAIITFLAKLCMLKTLITIFSFYQLHYLHFPHLMSVPFKTAQDI